MRDFSWRLPGLFAMCVVSAWAILALSVSSAWGQPAPGAEWRQVVEAAKREGSVVIAGPPARALRAALTDEFAKSFPEIKIEYVGGFPHELEPRIVAERQAGKHLWDIYVNGPPSAIFTLKPKGALDPLVPALLLPEVRDEKHWFGGFKPGMGFADKEAPLTFFLFDATASAVVHLNRSVVRKDEVRSFTDLLDPKWKGKIVMDDPRREGPGVNALAIFALNYGKEFVQRLLSQQDVAMTRQPRQIAEWVARGTYPIGIGVGTGPITDLRKEGVGREVELFVPELPVAQSITPGWGAVALVNRAPHPNAARVYVNWLLSREGQQAWVKALETRNSRRVDIPPGDPDLAVKQGIKYVVSQSEEAMPLRLQMKTLAEQLIRQ